MKTVYLIGPASGLPGNNSPAFHDARRARPLDDWHEDFGAVLWWRFPVEEAPWCGTPNCEDWPGYHTHWTPLVVPHAPAAGPDEPEVISEAPGPETDAGGVPPGPAQYEVTYTHKHRTLKPGDLVRMAETPDYNLLLIRADWTLHSLRDEHDQYVHLRRVVHLDDASNRDELMAFDGAQRAHEPGARHNCRSARCRCASARWAG